MKSPIYSCVVFFLVFILFPMIAWGETDLTAMESGLASIKAELAGKMDTWSATADEVSEGQATAEIETYEEAYDRLMQAKSELEAYESRLYGYLKDALQFQADHPDMTPAEQAAVDRIVDAVDSLAVRVDSFLLRISVIEVAQAALEGGEAVAAPDTEPELRSTGDVSILTGNGTYADYDRQYLSLRQRYKDREGRYFTFWEKYDNDHSFTDVRRWEFGMSQEFPDVFNGELNLREKLTDLKDLNNNANTRRTVALHLDYEYLFNGDQSLVDFAWDYKSKNYDAISTRSYLYHRAGLYAMHPLSDRVTADAFWRMTDYHYAQGDALGYNMTKLGLGLEFVPNDEWLWGMDYVSTEKSYDVMKTRAYFDDDFKIWGAYWPNARAYGEGELRFLQRNYRRATATDYDETRLKLRYWREFNEALDGDFKLEWRDKEFSAVSPSDYDYWRWQMAFNYNPSYNARWYYNFDYYDYDYNGITRSYSRMYHRAGLNYNWDNGTSMTTELAFTDQDYSANTGRDYRIWDFLADVYYPFERNQYMRFYFDWSSLDQSFANSVNDYTAYSWGIEYNWRMSPHYRLTLGYDYDLRDYKNQPRIKDQTFEARVRFEF